MKLQMRVIFAMSLAAMAALPAVAQVTGSGTTNYIPVWKSGSSVGNSIISQSSSVVSIGGQVSSNGFQIGGYNAVTQNPFFASLAVGSWALPDLDGGLSNTAVGAYTLSAVINGSYYTALGASALQANSYGGWNTAAGNNALHSNTNGNQNTATGYNALYYNTTGSYNTATGLEALSQNQTGYYNTALGVSALFSNTTGGYNTAVGYNALNNNAGGLNNIAFGYTAATSVSGGAYNNIHIGSVGSSSDSNTIRIGGAVNGFPAQTAFFAAGISGTNVSGAPVVVSSTGQLGVVNSSIRFKEDVRDMADASTGLLQLRPVTYRYKEAFVDGSRPVDYGLIAEEVAEVYPDLVMRSADGEIQTVQYQKLTPMLLNALNKQHRLIEKLEKRPAALEAQ